MHKKSTLHQSGLFKVPQLPVKPPFGVSRPYSSKWGEKKGVAGEATKGMMDMDETLLNAVDLVGIEMQVQAGNLHTGEKRSSVGHHTTSAASTSKRTKHDIATVNTTTQKQGESYKEFSQWTDDTLNAEIDRLSDGSDPVTTLASKKPLSCALDSSMFNLEDDDALIPCYQPTAIEPNDQVDTDDILQAQVDQHGQRSVTRIGTQLPTEDAFSVTTNNFLCSQYIRLERKTVQENEDNVLEDVIDTQKAREYDSTQTRRELQRIFEDCERSLMDMSSSFEIPNTQSEASKLANDINWDEVVAEVENRSIPTETVTLDLRKKYTPQKYSYFPNKGSFFGLPTKVKTILKEYRGIDDLYDWQKECLGLSAITERHNLIYALPTSGGKTLVSEIIMFREVICREKNVIFVVPYVSLAQEKLTALSPFAVEMQFLVEEYSGGKGMCPPRKRRKKNSIFVCTIEKSLLLLDSLIEVDRANEVGLVVIDELHMIGEERRGICLEALITKIQAIKAGIQIVGMSATIGNLNELAKFMTADIYCRDFRPVELKEYVKCGGELIAINNKAEKLEDVFGNKETLHCPYTEELKRVDPDHVIGLVLDVIPKDSCLIFCPTKKQCEQLCSLLQEYLPVHLTEHRANEKSQLIEALNRDGTTATILSKAFRYGIAYHHSGLTQDERRLIEDAFRIGVISLIVCTSTLAAGVNLPAKRVIIRSPYVGLSFITLSRYKQMAGRAGRAGLGEPGDSILICSQKDIPLVCNMLCSPMDYANSSLQTADGIYLKQLILSVIGMGICSTRNDVQKLMKSTLLATQAERLGVDTRIITDQAIKDLYTSNAVKAKSDRCLRNPPNVTIRIDSADATQHFDQTVDANASEQLSDILVCRGKAGSSQEGKLVKKIRKNTRLEVNQLGKAAIRAGFSMEKAIRYYDEMNIIGERLHVLDELHMIYLILLDDGREIRAKDSDYLAFITQLTPKEISIAQRFNITDATISRILKRRSVPLDLGPQVLRFYRTMIVYDLWRQSTVQQAAMKFRVDAGSVQSLMTNTAATASSLLRLCEELPDVWAFKHLLTAMVQRLSHCCSVELIPLMELPSVKIGRARQLYRAGYKTIPDVAATTATKLMNAIEYLNFRSANQLIQSAKAKLMEEVDAMREAVEDYLQVLNK